MYIYIYIFTCIRHVMRSAIYIERYAYNHTYIYIYTYIHNYKKQMIHCKMPGGRGCIVAMVVESDPHTCHMTHSIASCPARPSMPCLLRLKRALCWG